MEEEVFKDIAGYEGLYSISNKGRVKSLARSVAHMKRLIKINEKILVPRLSRDGYQMVNLSKNGIIKTHLVHILNANANIPNPFSKLEINHIDGDKTNNDLSNLERVTHEENMAHAAKMGLCRKEGAKVIDICTQKSYRSIKEAAKAILVPYSTCRNYLSGNMPNKTCLRYVA